MKNPTLAGRALDDRSGKFDKFEITRSARKKQARTQHRGQHRQGRDDDLLIDDGDPCTEAEMAHSRWRK